MPWLVLIFENPTRGALVYLYILYTQTSTSCSKLSFLKQNGHPPPVQQHVLTVLQYINLEQKRGGSFINHVDFLDWITSIIPDFKCSAYFFEISVAYLC